MITVAVRPAPEMTSPAIEQDLLSHGVLTRGETERRSGPVPAGNHTEIDTRRNLHTHTRPREVADRDRLGAVPAQERARLV